jgi:hypothetical protein
MKRAPQSARNRKVTCPECGYTVRMARSWMAVGLPTCPCGEQLRPDSPADLAFVGLIDQGDVAGPVWTAICKENRWDDAIVRRGAAAKAYARHLRAAGGVLGRPRGAKHCVFAGCGRWVAAGADRCTAGHEQHDAAAPVEAAPF